MDYKLLLKKAEEAREFSYSPYSKCRMGAAVLTKSGKIYTGCNIESVSFTPSICAERTAIFKAVSEGEKEFEAIVIATSLEALPFPCGVCRQVMCEFFDPKTKVMCCSKNGETKTIKFEELVPYPFLSYEK